METMNLDKFPDSYVPISQPNKKLKQKPRISGLSNNSSVLVERAPLGNLDRKNRHAAPGGKSFADEYETFEETPLLIAFFTYFSYIILNLMGRLQDFLRKYNIIKNKLSVDSLNNKGFVPLYQDYESFYTRNLYRRIRDCWNRPVASTPGAEIDLVDRVSHDYGWTFEYKSTKTRCINFGSYNYLGYAESSSETFNANKECILKNGIALCSYRIDIAGNHQIIRELEQNVANYVGQEDAIVFGMGFATNALNIPCLIDKHCCVVSDELNHTSLILGMRLSGAQILRFKHNNMSSLEQQLRQAVIYGHPKTRRPYKKILIIVEGIYSMEGSIVRLPEVIALKKKYKAFLYLDEAHSIGALGPNGGGAVDYFNCDPKDIDIAMGTFTKSFGSAGGYIAGSKRLIDFIRSNSHSNFYATTMTPIVCQQIISVIHSIMYKEEGRYKIEKLAWNIQYFRRGLHKMGLIVYGHKDSAVIPVIIFLPGKIANTSRECLKRGLGIVVVGFPATPLILGRSRFCVSACHTKEMLDYALSKLEEVVYLLNMRYSRVPPPEWIHQPMPPEPKLETKLLKKINTKYHDKKYCPDLFTESEPEK